MFGTLYYRFRVWKKMPELKEIITTTPGLIALAAWVSFFAMLLCMTMWGARFAD